MCGISGYLDTRQGVNLEVLQRMTDVIRHRGPDDEGYALMNGRETSFYGGKDTLKSLKLPDLNTGLPQKAFLGFGHRRLSILDLSAGGHQPMHLPGRDLTVTYNGEIYNYIELRTQLEEMGYSFQTTSDTEVLLYAYCAWGEDCLSHMNGMWGFALWDGKENKLFCARDRLGAKPFHYFLRANRFLFGSELKQLCQDQSESYHFHQPYLAANLIYRISDYSDETLIQDIHALRPGHKLVLRVDTAKMEISSVEIQPYWTLRVNYDYTKTEEYWLDRVEEEFSRACRWRMRSDAPVGILLSGGLDSSCVVTEVCGQMSDPSQLHTFTTHYPGEKSCDEWHFAEIVNQFCGCTGTAITPKPENMDERFAKLVWSIEGIGGLALIGVQILMERIANSGFKVLLNGQCGDELMLGYERYYAFFFSQLIKRGKVLAMLKELKLASQHSKLSLKDLIAYSLYFNIPGVRDSRQRNRSASFIQNSLINSVETEELHRLLFPKSLEALQYTELTATQLTHIVRFDDRLYMSASLESRIPFMDYRFVELACKIPPEFKIKNGYTKYLMRQVFDNRMPKEVTWRTNKMGFGAPTSKWSTAFSKEYLLDRIRNAKTASYFKQKALENQVLSDKLPTSIFEFLSIEEFARQFHVN